MAQGSEFPLKKPPGFHYDFFLLGITTVSSCLGSQSPELTHFSVVHCWPHRRSGTQWPYPSSADSYNFPPYYAAFEAREGR